MAAPLFDTHEAISELHGVGVETAVAEALVRTIHRGLGDNVATKADLAELRAETRTEIAAVRTEVAELRAETRTEIAAVRTEIAELNANIATEFKNLYRSLWIMGASIVALNVTLTVTLTKVLS